MNESPLLLRWQREPLTFKHNFWPHVHFYEKQVEIIHSVRDSVETYAPAGNMLGKDFVAGFIALWFFLAFKDVRIVTTSTTAEHLNVLWAEIDRFIRTSREPLRAEDGGPLQFNHWEIKKVLNGQVYDDIYLIGRVASSTQKGEGLAGHHAPHTLGIIDEASGVHDVAYNMMQGWAKRILIIGNPNPCTNFFYRGVKAGNLDAVGVDE